MKGHIMATIHLNLPFSKLLKMTTSSPTTHPMLWRCLKISAYCNESKKEEEANEDIYGKANDKKKLVMVTLLYKRFCGELKALFKRLRSWGFDFDFQSSAYRLQMQIISQEQKLKLGPNAAWRINKVIACAGIWMHMRGYLFHGASPRTTCALIVKEGAVSLLLLTKV